MPNVPYVHNASENLEVPQRGNTDEGAPYVIPLMWNPTTLAFELPKQPAIEFTGDLTVTMGDVERLLADNYWKDKRLDWTSGDLDYMGVNVTAGAATNAATWYVFKYTWASGNCTRIQGPVVGSWDGRPALF